jgi:carbon-monoxide dehydrogenase medium subunit
MPQFQHRRPGSLREAEDLVAAGGTPYCGGTELLAAMRLGLLAPDTLVDLKRVAELDGIAEIGDEIALRARVTHTRASESALLRRRAPVFASATSRLGNARVRATGTVAGNICFAEPRSDVLTALMALGARVELGSAAGERSVPIEEFVEAGFVTVREPSELVREIRVRKQRGPGAYLRFQPGEYPTVTVAVTSWPGGCRVVVGAVADRPRGFDFPGLSDVDPTMISERVEVTADLSGAEDYKRHLTSVFVRRAVTAVERAA